MPHRPFRTAHPRLEQIPPTQNRRRWRR
jgi:hypothetical protein